MSKTVGGALTVAIGMIGTLVGCASVESKPVVTGSAWTDEHVANAIRSGPKGLSFLEIVPGSSSLGSLADRWKCSRGEPAKAPKQTVRCVGTDGAGAQLWLRVKDDIVSTLTLDLHDDTLDVAAACIRHSKVVAVLATKLPGEPSKHDRYCTTGPEGPQIDAESCTEWRVGQNKVLVRTVPTTDLAARAVTTLSVTTIEGIGCGS